MSQDALTDREREILACMIEGLSNHEIAARLHLAPSTVKWYNSQIYSKLGVSNRERAVAQAQALGLLPESSLDEAQRVVRHNLPTQITPFIGRQQELAEIARLLTDPGTRLVTVLAPGGMGKTRLGLAAAEQQLRRYADGVFFVPLAPLSSPDDIVTAIAENIGFVFHGENKAPQQLVDFLKERSMLLILDNFEHLLEGASVVTEIIQTAAHIKILVTSRERLNIHGEYVYALSGLVFPTWETPKDALDYDAVKLFMQSAKRTRSTFELHPDDLDFLARICKLTAGMPLGIELAAGWLDVLTVEQIAGEIQQGIDIFETEMRDIPKRHRSLRATFERTWVRLTENEQQVFRKLSVFRGGFTLEAAQAVVGANIRQLRKLAQKALIQTDGNERHAIHELLRQFGASKLEESGELEAVQAKHAAYFTDFMVEQEHNLKNGEQLTGLTRIDHDFENMRLAWRYLVDHQQWDQLPKYRYSLWFYFSVRARSQDLLALLNYAREVLDTLIPSADVQMTIGRMIAWSSWFYHDLGSDDLALDCSARAIEILQAFGNCTEDLIIAHHTLVRHAIYHVDDRTSHQSIATQNYQLALELGDPTWLGQTSVFVTFMFEPGMKIDMLYESKKWFEQTGDRHGLWMCCLAEAEHLLRTNQLQEAKDILEYGESLIAPFQSAWHLAQAKRFTGVCNLMLGDNERARYHFTVALQHLWEAGYTYNCYGHLLRIAQTHLNEHNLELAVVILLVLEDAPPALRDTHYSMDKRIKAQTSYDDLRRALEQQLKEAQLEHLWDLAEKPTLSELIAELVGDLEEV